MSWIETWPSRVSSKQRGKKFEQFFRLMEPSRDDTVVDVGINDKEYSEADNYLEKHYAYPENITAVARKGLDHFRARYPRVKALIADGRKLPFPDNYFDISYSNAVIEHVGKRVAQLQFLRELYRVAHRGYLTTPNRYFPVEVHSRIPLLHIFLKKNWFDRFLRLIGKGWAAGDYMYLLSYAELEGLLREAEVTNYKIISNRFLGLAMTFTVVWHKDTSVLEI
ncbi:MAG: class I SAM-dependent methyltransferase [Beijerinckiaceae bacterium]